MSPRKQRIQRLESERRMVEQASQELFKSKEKLFVQSKVIEHDNFALDPSSVPMGVRFLRKTKTDNILVEGLSYEQDGKMSRAQFQKHKARVEQQYKENIFMKLKDQLIEFEQE